jgi:hypothetical protein
MSALSRVPRNGICFTSPNHEVSAGAGVSHSTGTTLPSALTSGRHTGAIHGTRSMRTGPTSKGARSKRASAAERRSRGSSAAGGSCARTRSSITARSRRRGAAPLFAVAARLISAFHTFCRLRATARAMPGSSDTRSSSLNPFAPIAAWIAGSRCSAWTGCTNPPAKRAVS